MSNKKRTPAQELLVRFRQRRAYSQEQLAGLLKVQRSTVGRWESAEDPSAYYLGELAALARREGAADLALGFSRLQSERNRISLYPWETAIRALRACQQVFEHHKQLTGQGRWNVAQDCIGLAIDSLDEDETATSEPSADKLIVANRAVDAMTRLVGEVSRHRPDTSKERS